MTNQSKWEDLHKTWAKAIGNTSNNLFGTTNDAFWKHTEEVVKFIREYFCTNCTFVKQTSSYQIQFVSSLMPAKDNVACLFQKEEGFNQGSCGRCNKVTRGAENTWFFLIEKDLMPYTLEEYLLLQKKVNLGKTYFICIYCLCYVFNSIVFYFSDKKEGPGSPT